MEVRIKFSADIYIEGKDLKEVKSKFEEMPIFCVEALDCGAEYSETLLVENAETCDDLETEWDEL